MFTKLQNNKQPNSIAKITAHFLNL